MRDGECDLHSIAVYKRVLRDACTLQEGELSVVNIDLDAALSIAEDVLPKVSACLNRLHDVFRNPDEGMVHRLEARTLALRIAQERYSHTKTKREQASDAAAKLIRLRNRMWLEVQGLIKQRYLPRGSLRSLRRNKTHADLVHCVEGLLALLRKWDEQYPNIRFESRTTRSEARERLVELRENETCPFEYRDAVDARVRIFSLFLKSYNEVREHLAFVPEAAGLMPSLYLGRKKRKGA